MTTEDLAKLAECNVETVRRLVRSGKLIPKETIGKMYTFRLSDVAKVRGMIAVEKRHKPDNADPSDLEGGEYVELTEAAALVDVHVRTVRRWMEGHPDVKKVEGKTYVPRSLLAERRTDAA